MYTVPLIALIVLALIAVAWSPIFALVLAGALFLLFLAYVGLRPRADEKIDSPTGSAGKYEDDVPKGPWGEPRA